MQFTPLRTGSVGGGGQRGTGHGTIYTSAAEVRDRSRPAHGAFYSTISLPGGVYTTRAGKGLKRITSMGGRAPIHDHVEGLGTGSRGVAGAQYPRRELRGDKDVNAALLRPAPSWLSLHTGSECSA